MKKTLNASPGDWKPALLALPSLLLAAGCTAVGPEPKAVAPQAPAHFTGHSESSSLALPKEGRWWGVFQDPVLDRLVERALQQSPSLEAIAARVDEARARLGLSRAAGRPSLTLSGSSRLVGESSERVLPIPNNPIRYRDSGDSWRAALDASWEPDLWGRIQRGRQAAEARLEASLADEAGARLALQSEVAAVYLNFAGLYEEGLVLTRSLESRRQTVELLQVRLRGGLSNEAELFRAKAELAATEAELTELSRRRDNAANTLAFLCAGSLEDLGLPKQSFLPKPPAIPEGLPLEMLQRRPDVAAAEALLRARTADIGVAMAARYPAIRLTAGGGVESHALGELLNRPAQFWQLGPVLSLPVLDGGRTKAELAAAEAAAKAAIADHRQRCLVALREVEEALNDRTRLQEAETLLKQAAQAAKEAESLLQGRYQSGLNTYLEVLDAQRSALQAERALAANQSALLAATVRLIRALGGGW